MSIKNVIDFIKWVKAMDYHTFAKCLNKKSNDVWVKDMWAKVHSNFTDLLCDSTIAEHLWKEFKFQTETSYNRSWEFKTFDEASAFLHGVYEMTETEDIEIVGVKRISPNIFEAMIKDSSEEGLNRYEERKVLKADFLSLSFTEKNKNNTDLLSE